MLIGGSQENFMGKNRFAWWAGRKAFEQITFILQQLNTGQGPDQANTAVFY
jgi:hypothetical protein